MYAIKLSYYSTILELGHCGGVSRIFALVRLYLVRLYLKVAQKWLQSMKYDRYNAPL